MLFARCYLQGSSGFLRLAASFHNEISTANSRSSGTLKTSSGKARYIPGMELAHPHNSAYKYLFKNKRIFLQLLQSFVPEDFVQNLTVDDLDTVRESYISEEFINRESDLIYKVRQGNSRSGQEGC